MATINDILISELDRASVPAVPEDELVINQKDKSGEFVTRRINWSEIGQSIKDLSSDPNRPDISDQILFGDGTEPAPSITFKNDQSTGIYRPILAFPSMAVSANGQEVMRFTHTANYAKVGIGFHNSDNDVPLDGLHIKSGGVLLDWGAGLQYNITKFTAPDWSDTTKFDTNVRLNVTTNNNLTFATGDKERGRFTKQGNFAFYGSLGVGGYSGETIITPDYGKKGDSNGTGSILISQGESSNVIWKDPDDFFEENTTLITNILTNSPIFISELIGDLHLDDGLEVVTNTTSTGEIEYALRVDNTIARAVYTKANGNKEIESEKLTATKELFFHSVSPLP